jgi:ubiquinone biosynthesis protein COQ4
MQSARLPNCRRANQCSTLTSGTEISFVRSPLAVMLIFGGMLSVLQNGESLEPMLKALARGFQMGLEAELVIARKLDDGWERPLQEWRQELRLNVN